ncbi:MAG: dihydroxyacetone kinase phosphoryl donor subunit DhaM [Corynebacterium sp.]|nr:dihydroxyacetone kinase phosphoryl donor subunit DhaM [Corynebacterium sp.]
MASDISVGIVLVSHSATLAKGLAELAAQMAPAVEIIPAGGMDDGGIGTSYNKVEKAVTDLLAKKLSVAIYTDLGSATLTVETLLDFYDDEPVRFIPGPFVELTVAGAVAAQTGAKLEDLPSSLPGESGSSGAPAASSQPQREDPDPILDYSRTVTVADPSGLHARPAAHIAELAAEAIDDLTINGEEADSPMLLMGLGIKQGDSVAVAGKKDDKAVIDAIADFIESGA